MILTHTQWMWFCTIVTFATSAVWIVVDVIRLSRALPRDQSNRHDRIFGSIMGILIGLVGVFGVLKFNLG